MGKKVVVIYKSKYGTIKRYAGWIALKLEADLYEVSDIRNKDLKNYDLIIFGGPLYVGKIKGVSFINKNADRLLDKKLIIFTVGMMSENESYKNDMIKSNFDENISKNIKLFYFRGKFNYNELNLIDKVLMKFMKGKIESKSKLNEDDKNILKGFYEEVDLSDKKSINSLLEYIYQENC